MAVERRMDELGRIVIPMELRQAINAEARDTFILKQTSADTLELRVKNREGCVHCHSGDHLIQTPLGTLCEDCALTLVTQMLKSRA